MKDKKNCYRCSECGASYIRWSGKCPNCDQWDTLQEITGRSRGTGRAATGAIDARELVFSLPDTPRESLKRTSCGIGELDRVLGGGLLPGCVVLIGGDPGVGKSTLLLQALSRLASAGHKSLYVTCEESLSQLSVRAARLGYAGAPLRVSAENSLDTILPLLESEKPQTVVIDSIQMVADGDPESPVGSVSQLKTATAELAGCAKKHNFTLFLVGHVTKQGALAGPKTIEHMVDTVLYFESERFHTMRILRAAKNRFGSINEIGVFQMTEQGLEGVNNPSELFLSERHGTQSGSVVTPTVEGRRALLVEVQALIARSSYGTPERQTGGVDRRRFGMLLTVLERRAGLKLGGCDAFANVAGGVNIAEPSADLPLALAIVSSTRDTPFPSDWVAMGEIGLSGEIRAVGHLEQRLKESAKLGFKKALVPQGNFSQASNSPLPLQTLSNIGDISRIFHKPTA